MTLLDQLAASAGDEWRESRDPVARGLFAIAAALAMAGAACAHELRLLGVGAEGEPGAALDFTNQLCPKIEGLAEAIREAGLAAGRE